MGFTVETGAGLSNANSYTSVAEADTYHADRGNSSWAPLDTATKQALLIRATDYIDQEYGQLFIGSRETDAQALEWPRIDVDTIYLDVVPTALKQAVCLLAMEAKTTDLNPSLARGGAVKRQKVDVIEVEFMDGASNKTSRPAIAGLLRRLINSSSPFNAKVQRV